MPSFAIRCLCMTIVPLCFSACGRNGSQNTNLPAPAQTAPAHVPSSHAPQPAAKAAPPEISNPESEIDSKLPRASSEPYAGPRVTVQLLKPEVDQGLYARISVTTNTGGWSLNLDEGHVVDGVAKIFMTLERPAADEMVTQALVNHSKDFVSSQPFTSAEVYIHLAQRGVQTLTTDYRLAARAEGRTLQIAE